MMHNPKDWLAKQQDAMLALVCDWARCNSGSYNMAGLQQQMQYVNQAFSVLQGESHIIKAKPYFIVNDDGEFVPNQCGDIFTLVKNPKAERQILLMGHMDTVFGATHPFQTITTKPNGLLNGPGVADMKGGLVVMLYALQALAMSPYQDKLGYQVIINADEELGSFGSSHLFSAAAKNAQLGFVYEPAMDALGTLAGARKGSGKFTAVIRGIAAHAGRAFAEGRNAIVAAAEWVTRVHALNQQREDVTLNVGIIRGGHALNVVPDLAIVRVDIRTREKADESWISEHLQTISDEVARALDVTIDLHGQFGRPPKPLTDETLRLFEWVKQHASQQQLALDWRPSGGCCDGNNLADLGLPVIDTLGVRGANIHSADEYMCIDSLVERAQLSAALFIALAEGEFFDH